MKAMGVEGTDFLAFWGAGHVTSASDPAAAYDLAALLVSAALASPYLFNYDLPFLVYPLLWLVQSGLTRGFRPYEKLGLVVLFIAPYATRAAALPLEINLMPLAALAVLWLVWSRAGKAQQAVAPTIGEIPGDSRAKH